MKNIILVLFVFISSLLVAQTSNGYVSFVADTTTNAETEYLVLSSPRALTNNYTVTMTITPVNSSGTATVLGTPQGSFDNTTFYDLAVADTINNASTVAITNVVYPNAYYRYYRWKCVSTGTGVTILNGILGTKRIK